jgi:hypothetical protein
MQPPMPICARLVGGTLASLVACDQCVVCIRSSMVVSAVSMCLSKWMMPSLPSTCLISAFASG